MTHPDRVADAKGRAFGADPPCPIRDRWRPCRLVGGRGDVTSSRHADESAAGWNGQRGSATGRSATIFPGSCHEREVDLALERTPAAVSLLVIGTPCHLLTGWSWLAERDRRIGMRSGGPPADRMSRGHRRADPTSSGSGSAAGWGASPRVLLVRS